jgi:hypothetical protein
MSITFEPLNSVDWGLLDAFPDRTLFQTRAWIEFVAEAQEAVPVVLAVRIDNQVVGYFTGLTVRRGGFKILGSPFPGWSTSYLGFNLIDGVDRASLVEPLAKFAFRELGYWHIELMDRYLTVEQMNLLGWEGRNFSNTEIDLAVGEDRIFANLKGSCRTSIRKAENSGVTIEIADDDRFSSDFYAQLTEVFAKQGLRPTYSIRRIDLLRKHLGPTGNLLCLRARNAEGVCIATGIYPAFRDRMYFFGGASLKQYQILQPNELVQWFAMRHWKERGALACDMGGGGEYKLKYGGRPIVIPWRRRSKYSWVGVLRRLAQQSHARLRRFRGRF